MINRGSNTRCPIHLIYFLEIYMFTDFEQRFSPKSINDIVFANDDTRCAAPLISNTMIQSPGW